MIIVVTGADGFVGSNLVEHLLGTGHVVRRFVREASPEDTIGTYAVGDLGLEPDLGSLLIGADVVIHCAGRAHVAIENAADALAEYRRVNVNGTVNLARQCIHAGVKRFIFISSIAVNGKFTKNGSVFGADDAAVPVDFYGISKYEAEMSLTRLSQDSYMDLVIVRPPMIYGRGVKGNFDRLVRLIRKGVPLPVGLCDGILRAFVGIDNLVSFLVFCCDLQVAARGVYLIRDEVEVSVRKFFEMVAEAVDVQPRFLNFPPSLARWILAKCGKESLANQLFKDLRISNASVLSLGWCPPYSMSECLSRSV